MGATEQRDHCAICGKLPNDPHYEAEFANNQWEQWMRCNHCGEWTELFDVEWDDEKQKQQEQAQ